MVPGGLLVTSSVTRFTCETSLVIRVDMRANRSYGRRDQSAVMASEVAIQALGHATSLGSSKVRVCVTHLIRSWQRSLRCLIRLILKDSTTSKRSQLGLVSLHLREEIPQWYQHSLLQCQRMH